MLSIISHSILILTRDRPNLLPRAVRSALAALHSTGELIIVDDGSSVPASHVLGDLLIGQNARVIRLSQPLGIAAARNVALSHARGQVIFFLDDDDVIHAKYVRNIIFEVPGIVSYGFCRCRLIEADGNVILPKPRFETGPIPEAAPLRKQLCGMGEGFWIRREAAESNGLFAVNLIVAEDTDYVCRLISNDLRAWYSAVPGVDVYIHDNDIDMKNITRRVTPEEYAVVLRLLGERNPQYRHVFFRLFLKHCAKVRLRKEAITFLRSQKMNHHRILFMIYFYIRWYIYYIR